MSDELREGLLRYIGARQQQRSDAVDRALDTLTPYERRLVREAAVMGYVLGVQSGPYRSEIPPDSMVVTEVVDGCIAMGDLYPVIAAASRGER